MNRNVHCVLTIKYTKWLFVFYVYLQNENKVHKYHNYVPREKGEGAQK